MLERWLLTLNELVDCALDRVDARWPRLAPLTARIWPPGKTPHGPWEE